MDSIFLTGPLGTQFNIGSWLEKDAGVDYGAAGLIRQQLTQTTFVDGAQLAYESAAGPRRMTFPLIVPSGGVAGLSLDTLEASLRQMVRPGGFVDMKPENVPTAEMVRFDILGGDVAQRGYSVDLRRLSRTRLMLSLETQPFGYWPTWITLASVASVAMAPFVRVPILAASVIGDVPAAVRMALFSGIIGTTGYGVGSGMHDFQAWSLAMASAPAVLGATSSTAAYPKAFDSTASWFTGNASAAVIRASGAAFGAFSIAPFALWTLSRSAFGRHRVFGVFRLGGGNVQSLRALVDVPGYSVAPVATGNPVATIAPVASLGGASYFGLYDLGEVSIPGAPEASGMGVLYTGLIRLSVAGASDGSLATGTLDTAGLFLLPVNGPAGIMPRGLISPTPMAAVSGPRSLILDARARMAALVDTTSQATPNLDVGQELPALTALTYYRGGFPYIGGTDTTLQFMSFDRITSGTTVGRDAGPPMRINSAWGGYSISYQPRFSFLKGI